MRSSIVAASLVVLSLAVGCNLAPHHRGGGPLGGGTVAETTATPTVENLVKYLNRNADLVPPGQALTCGNVMIDASGEAGKVGIDAKMICQAPRNFLMSGVVLGNPAVDVGSNDKEFWYWSKQINPPYLYHCSYDNLARGVNVPFPFQPEMALNALGLAHYDPAKPYKMQIVDDKRGHKFIELTERALSPENKPVQKVTVFNYNQQQLPHPQVVAHILKDEQGKVILAANIHSAQRVGPNGPIVPHIVDFNWPEQKLKMTLRIENPRLTAMPPERAAEVFKRQNLRYQSFDLATHTVDGGGVQRAGASGPIYRP